MLVIQNYQYFGLTNLMLQGESMLLEHGLLIPKKYCIQLGLHGFALPRALIYVHVVGTHGLYSCTHPHPHPFHHRACPLH